MIKNQLCYRHILQSDILCYNNYICVTAVSFKYSSVTHIIGGALHPMPLTCVSCICTISAFDAPSRQILPLCHKSDPKERVSKGDGKEIGAQQTLGTTGSYRGKILRNAGKGKLAGFSYF